MERREEFHSLGCSIAKQTILTSHPSGLRTRVSVELACIDSVCIHHSECQSSPIKTLPNRQKNIWNSENIHRTPSGCMSTQGTPVLGRRSDLITEGRLSQQCSPVMRRKELLDSPAGSPVPSRKKDSDLLEECSDVDNCIISGWFKFRDNKRWKSRWGVITKLSPAADCVHLQVYREPRDRLRGGQVRASLSLQGYLGAESGFTLDRESHTLAVICRDVTVVLAFETRERLIAWQVKVRRELGTSQEFPVVVCSGGVPGGPARLHVREGAAALVGGRPPALLAVWQLDQLRRYGVVEGKFCVEGGSRCGRGAGLYVMLTDRPHELAACVERAAGAGGARTVGDEAQYDTCPPAPPAPPDFSPAWSMSRVPCTVRHENYDVPRPAPIGPSPAGELYDTPRRLRPLVVECGEAPAPSCACRSVTEWAGGLLAPYCGRRGSDPQYATVDLARKTRRPASPTPTTHDNYENLQFALSLRHYENARQVLRRAGITRGELRALAGEDTAVAEDEGSGREGGPAGEYLVMRPAPIPPPLEKSRSIPALNDACGATCPPRHNRDSSSSNDSGVCSRGSRGGGGSGGGGETGETAGSSSGTSDMSDYIDTLSLCSDHSDDRAACRSRPAPATCTLRPRSGGEYRAPPPAPRHTPAPSTLTTREQHYN